MVGDFGLSRPLTSAEIGGSPAFQSPEMLTGRPILNLASHAKADIWSLGLVAWCLWAGQYNPFPRYQRGWQVAQAIDRGEHLQLSMAVFGDAPDMVALVRRMLSRDPSKRPSAVDVALAVGSIADKAEHLRARGWPMAEVVPLPLGGAGDVGLDSSADAAATPGLTPAARGAAPTASPTGAAAAVSSFAVGHPIVSAPAMAAAPVVTAPTTAAGPRGGAAAAVALKLVAAPPPAAGTMATVATTMTATAVTASTAGDGFNAGGGGGGGAGVASPP